MRRMITTPAVSLKDLRILPGYTDFTNDEVSLKSCLCKKRSGFIRLSLPLISAAMHAVTGTSLATALGTLGGVSVLPLHESVKEQCRKIREVKQFRAGFQNRLITFSPDQPIQAVWAMIAKTTFTTYPVTDNGRFHGKLMGIITDKDFDPRYDLDCPIGKRMKTDVKYGVGIDHLKDANTLMIQYGRGFLPIVTEEGTLESVVFKKDLDRHIRFPESSLDDEKRILIGAATSTFEGEKERIAALIEADADFLVIDASDGLTRFQRKMLTWIKNRYDISVIGGNVITDEGFRMLVDAGADAVKIGMGIASGCTTQSVKATGRAQGTAIMEIAKARDEWIGSHGYIPLIADGGINTSADVMIALALGADTVMMGNFFARFKESPGRVLKRNGETVKEYWMEGSLKAKNHRRYYQNPEHFFEEGISGYVPYKGSIYDHLPLFKRKLKAAFATSGAKNIDELHRDAVLEIQSMAAIHDSLVHHMIVES